VPLRDRDDALMVNWCELTTTDAAGQVLYRNAWATSHRIDHSNVQAVTAAGRALRTCDGGRAAPRGRR
jgi:hypothetical protein